MYSYLDDEPDYLEEASSDEEDDFNQDWGGEFVGKYFRAPDYKGVIFYCYGDNGVEVKSHMVGDDREFIYPRDDIAIMDDSEHVCSCGQDGCGWD